MTQSEAPYITGAVEGYVDDAVLRRLLRHCKLNCGVIYGQKGKDYLRQRIAGLNAAARSSRWVVLVDQDRDSECAPELKHLWLPNPAPMMCFRIAVHEIEAWLLADRERISRFLKAPLSRVPHHPESLDKPKERMVDLSRLSRSRDIRLDMTPEPGSGRNVGPAYSSRLVEFIVDLENGWRPDVAAQNADSLSRCLRRLREI